MSSAIKTVNIGLNQWSQNENPKRQDFVDDNFKIDDEIGKVKVLIDNIDLVASKVTMNDGRTVELAVTTNTSNITKNTNAIATTNTKVTTNTDNIAKNTSAIAINTSDIATIKADIEINKANIINNTLGTFSTY